jgi:hypothetical protein
MYIVLQKKSTRYSCQKKGKVYSITGHESPESYIWVRGQRHTPAALPPEKNPITIAFYYDFKQT